MKGRSLTLYQINGEWLTIYEVAARLGVAKRTLDGYRWQTRCTVQEAYDHYDLLNRGIIQRGKPGRKPARYKLGNRMLTVKEAAGALGLSLVNMYRYLDKYGDLEACVRAIEKRKTDEAVREVVKTIRGAGK